MGKREVSGLVVFLIGVIAGIFSVVLIKALFFLILSIFVLILGIIIFLNKKEDIIEEIKEVK